MNSTTPWKYCYWLDAGSFARLQEQMRQQKREMTAAVQNPCEALRGDAGYAEPHVWQAICKFDAAPWYHQSAFNGRVLVATSSPLDEPYHTFLETTITPVDFTPSGLPASADLESLAGNRAFQERKPPAWDTFPREMGEQIVKGLATMSTDPPGSWDSLFQSWTAVHANFVAGRYRAGAAYDNAPYSVGTSFTISSCCVQLFNLFDSGEKALLVRPCTGAAILKVLTGDQYYCVRLVRNTGKTSDS
jgi:hypothetical protein